MSQAATRPMCFSPCLLMQAQWRILLPQRSGQAFHIAAAASTQAPQVFDPGYDDFDEVEAAIRATSDGSQVSTDELQWRSVADLESTSGPQASTALQNGAPLPSEAEVAIKQELGDCTEWQDVLQIVEEEKTVMTPACCADALARCAQLAKAAKEASKPVGSPVFQGLLQTLEQHAGELRHKETARALWALATLKHKPLKVMRALCGQAEEILPQLNTLDLSNSLWALGTLHFNPGTLSQDIAQRALVLVDQFEPKGLSSLLWGLSQLGVKPEAPLLPAVASHMEQNLFRFGPQAIANIMQAMSKLDFYSARLCSAVDRAVAADLANFPPREFNSLLWVFVHYRHAPSNAFWGSLSSHLIATDERGSAASTADADAASASGGVAHTQDEADSTPSPSGRGLQPWSATHWATLIWAAGKMAWQPQQQLWAVLQSAVERHKADFKPQELANMLWGMAILGECERPLFRQVFDATVSSHEKRPLEPRLLRQVYQGMVLASAAGVQLQVPSQLEATARKWWRSAGNGAPVSLSHAKVASRLRALGLAPEVQVPLADGLPSIDLALTRDDGQKFALQVIGPQGCMRNTTGLTGRAISDEFLLKSHGYTPIMLRVDSLPAGYNSQLAQLQFLSQLLSQHSISHPVSVQEAHDSMPDEFAPPRPEPAAQRRAESYNQQPRQHSGARASPSGTPDSGYSNGAYSNGRVEAEREAPAPFRQARAADSENMRQNGARGRHADSPASASGAAAGSFTGEQGNADSWQGAPLSRRPSQRADSRQAERAYPQSSRLRQPGRAPAVPDDSFTSEDAWGRADAASSGDGWGRVDAAAQNGSSAESSDAWSGWDDAAPASSRGNFPRATDSSSRPEASAAGRGRAKSGIRRTRNSLDLPALGKLAKEARRSKETSGPGNEW